MILLSNKDNLFYLSKAFHNNIEKAKYQRWIGVSILHKEFFKKIIAMKFKND
jgi:hypothetical protein